MVVEAINTARAAGAGGRILVRGDSAYGTSAVVTACVKAGAQFSVVLVKNPAVTRAIAAIGDERGARCTTPAPSWIPTPAS